MPLVDPITCVPYSCIHTAYLSIRAATGGDGGGRIAGRGQLDSAFYRPCQGAASHRVHTPDLRVLSHEIISYASPSLFALSCFSPLPHCIPSFSSPWPSFSHLAPWPAPTDQVRGPDACRERLSEAIRGQAVTAGIASELHVVVAAFSTACHDAVPAVVSLAGGCVPKVGLRVCECL